MKLFSQHFAFFELLIFITFYDQTANADSPSCGDWASYKDEKCYKILDDTFRTFTEAEKACEKLDNSPILPVIHTKEEQDFLANYLFKTEKKLDNFWIGAKFLSNQFHWIDNTDWSFANWDTRGQRNKTDYCVQIQSDESVIGKWIDEPCERKSLVVCQKMQSWSTARLQKVLLDARKEFRDSLEASNKMIADLKHNIDEANLKLSNHKHDIEEANKKISENKQNLIPIGFIYAQLPNEKLPSEIWPTMKWSDVSATYEGVFFRVNGSDAAAFGQVQQENAPRLEEIHTGNPDHMPNIAEWKSWLNGHYLIPKTGVSQGIYTGTDIGGGIPIFWNVKHSGGEIRPRNMAIRIWKRSG